MVGGVLQICGALALLSAVCEIISRALPRRLIDEMQEIYGDVSSPPIEPDAVARWRDRGAL